jgi:hypothetical protein
MQTDFDERSFRDLFESVLPMARWKGLQGRANAQIYTLRVVIRMMLLQRLSERGTQQRAVHETEAAQIVAWYRQRWNLELDLRTLKGTLRVKHLASKSKSAVEKELLIAVVAYGMVRALMAEAAERVGLHPRELSFTRAHGLLNAMTGKLCSPDADERQKVYDRLLAYIGQAKLPKRSKTRTYPRAVWGSGKYYPARHSIATQVQSK